MSLVKRHFTDGPYGQIHFRQAGERHSAKAPVMCLHMCPKSSVEFAPIVASLGDSRLVVAPDYPGHGESAPPPANPSVTINDYARSMWAVADALKLTDFDLIGSHTGSMVAAAMAIQRPNAIRRIIMISAVVLTPDEVKAYQNMLQPIPLDVAGTRFQKLWELFMQHRGPGVTLQMAAESMAEALRGGDAYEWGHIAAFNAVPDYIKQISRLTQPITLVNTHDGLEVATRRAIPLIKNGIIIEKSDWSFGFMTTETKAATELFQTVLDE